LEGAERESALAIKLNPNLAYAYDCYGWSLMFQGRFQEAEAAMKKAVDLEPLAAFTSTDLAFVYECARQFDKSIEAAKRAVDLDPRHPWAHHVLGWSLLHQGKPREAIPHFEQVRKLGENPTFRMSLGCAYAAVGDRAKAEAVIKELDDLATQRYVPAAARACIWTYLNEKDRALTQLERSVVERDPTCPWFKVDPAFDPLRTEPRFQALLKRVFPEP
jgi:tetratricopeptide (TPR) repeat protein